MTNLPQMPPVPSTRYYCSTDPKRVQHGETAAMVLASDYDSLRACAEAYLKALRVAVEALAELTDLMDGVRSGEYVPDSFTTQPARTALASVGPLPKEMT